MLNVTGEKTANNITVLPSITENRDITKYYKKIKIHGEIKKQMKKKH